MSKYFYFLLLIEYIKNNVNIYSLFDNITNNSFSINPIEISESNHSNNSWVEFNISSFGYIKQDYLFFYYYNKIFPLPKVNSFKIISEPLSNNYFININTFDIKCFSINNNTNLSDINFINYLLEIMSQNESNCIGTFDKNNNNIYEGIFYNNNSEIEKQKIILMIKYDWNTLSNIKIYLSNYMYNITPQEGIIKLNENEKEKGEYVVNPFYINLKDFANITKEIIFYSSTNSMKLYYLKKNKNIENIPSLLYQGNIIILYTNKDLINLIYNNVKEFFLIINSFDTNDAIEKYFEIKFNNNDNTNINYYYFYNENENCYNNNHISLQMIQQNQRYCFIANYHNNNEDNEFTSSEIYLELIYGKIKILNIYNVLNYSTWDELINNSKDYYLNESFYIINKSQNSSNIYFICAENENIPSMLHIYHPNFTNESSYIELSPGDTYINNIKESKNILINISHFSEHSEIDVALHAFNNEGIINVEVYVGNNYIRTIRKNNIAGFKIKIEDEKKKEIKIYNKGDYNCRIIIKIGLQINEKEDTKINDFYYNSKYNLYYFKFPPFFEQYKYSKIYINISQTQNELNNTNNKFLISDNLYNVVFPNFDYNYFISSINNKNASYSYEYFEIGNPLIMNNRGLYEKEKINYYLIIKTDENTNNSININVDYEKYDYVKKLELNNYYILSIDNNNKGFIIPNTERPKSYVQMFSCGNNNKSVYFEIYDNFYKNKYFTNYFNTSQYVYFPIENKYIDSSISFPEENEGNNIFINHFSYSNALYESMNHNFIIDYNNVTNTIHLNKPINGNQTKFNYTIFLDKKGELVVKNINLCKILSTDNLNELTYYIANITDNDFTDNEYKLDFSSEILKNYKSFDMLIYAKEVPYGMHFLSEIISNQFIEEKKAILIENIFEKNNEKLLYYIGKLEQLNYFKINTNSNYEFLLTLHFWNNFNRNKISIDCAQIKSDLVKDIIIALSQQKNKDICKILDLKNNNDKIVIIFVKMLKNSYNSLAIRIINDIENCEFALYMDKDSFSYNKEIIIDEEEENKLISINHPFCFKYYKIYLDDVINTKYKQIGLYSQVNNSISILINDDMNDKTVIDYGNFIVIYTDENFIKDNYYQNKELIVIIGDDNKKILNISEIYVEPMKFNIIGLTKKNSNEKKNKINLIDYYLYNGISNINEIFAPLYINKCDNSLYNFIVLKIRLKTNLNNNQKKYIKINVDFGDIPLIEYSNILNKESFNDEINNLISLDLKEKNLISLENNNIYIFKIFCKNYLFMNINGYEVNTEQKKDNYILQSGSIINIPLNSYESTNLNLKELKNSNLTKIELSNEQINFNAILEINKNEQISLNAKNRILILELDKKKIDTIKIKAKEEKGYIQIITNINNNELVIEENDDYLSYNNRELYIYSHKIEPNNDLIKIKIPIINKDKSKYISVCYYLSQIIIKNKKIKNCFTISENSFENITIINPYTINNDNYYDNNINYLEYFYNISNMHVIFYKNGKNSDNKLELKEVIIEEEGNNKTNRRKDPNYGDNEYLSTKVGRVILIIFIVIIVLIVIFFVFIYVRKMNIKKKEMNYQAEAGFNNENELLAQGIYSPLNRSTLSIND